MYFSYKLYPKLNFHSLCSVIQKKSVGKKKSECLTAISYFHFQRNGP